MKQYLSDRKSKDYTFHPGKQFQLDLEAISGLYPDGVNQCYLVALDDRSINVILALIATFLPYYWVWGLPGPMRAWDSQTEQEWANIQDFYQQIEGCLMSGCEVSELITAVNSINTSLSHNGKNIAEQVSDLNAAVSAMSAKLDTIATKIDETGFPVEEVDDVEEILDSINGILGAAKILGAI